VGEILPEGVRSSNQSPLKNPQATETSSKMGDILDAKSPLFASMASVFLQFPGKN